MRGKRNEKWQKRIEEAKRKSDVWEVINGGDDQDQSKKKIDK